MGRRWDTDERGRGVASAESGVPRLEQLRAAMLERDWVAEEPELHLLPHIRRACAERGWTVRRAEVVAAVLEVEIAMLGGSARTPTEAAYQLIGTFAEPSTHIVATKRDVGRDVEVVVTTGVLEGDSDFAPHGHVVRLRVETGGTAQPSRSGRE